MPGMGDGVLFRDVTPETIRAIVDLAGAGSGSPFLSYEARHLGGELARPSAEHGAVASLDGSSSRSGSPSR